MTVPTEPSRKVAACTATSSKVPWRSVGASPCWVAGLQGSDRSGAQAATAKRWISRVVRKSSSSTNAGHGWVCSIASINCSRLLPSTAWRWNGSAKAIKSVACFRMADTKRWGISCASSTSSRRSPFGAALSIPRSTTFQSMPRSPPLVRLGTGPPTTSAYVLLSQSRQVITATPRLTRGRSHSTKCLLATTNSVLMPAALRLAIPTAIVVLPEPGGPTTTFEPVFIADTSVAGRSGATSTPSALALCTDRTAHLAAGTHVGSGGRNARSQSDNTRSVNRLNGS